MKSLKKILALLLALVMGLGLVACGPAGTTESNPPSGTSNPPATSNTPVDPVQKYEEWVKYTYSSNLDTADPYGSTSAQCQFFTNMTFDTLTYVDADTSEVMPELAHSWKDVNGDGLVWDVYLEKGVTFHNGDKFTAEDVKFTWEYAGAGQNNVVKPLAAYTYCDSIEVVDELTVRFNLVNAMPDFPSYLETKIYSKNAFETMDPLEAGVIGTGPYYYDEKNTDANQYVASRYDNYWKGIENYPTLHIACVVLSDKNTAVASLQAGEIDYFPNFDASFYNTLSATDGLNIVTRSGAQSYYMGFNYGNDMWNDVELRRAICQAINKEDVVNVAYEGGVGGNASYNFCVPTGMGYTEVESLTYDLDAAKAYLEGKNLEITLIHYAGVCVKIAEVIQANLKAAGVTVNLRQVDGTNWTSVKASQDGYDLFLDYCAYQGALLYNFNRFFYRGGSSNVFGYASDAYEAAQDKVQSYGTFEEMLTEFGNLQQFVADEVPIFPIVYNNFLAAAQEDVEGIVLAPSMNYCDFSTLRIPARD